MLLRYLKNIIKFKKLNAKKKDLPKILCSYLIYLWLFQKLWFIGVPKAI